MLAVVIEKTQIVLRLCDALVSGTFVLLRRRLVVLCDAVTILIHVTQAELSIRIAIFRERASFTHCRGDVASFSRHQTLLVIGAPSRQRNKNQYRDKTDC